MKYLLLAFIGLLFGASTLTAQTAVRGPKMQFDTMTIDFGTVGKGSDPVRRLKFTNLGNEVLIIKTAKGSCGCTVPTFPKEPILPGESDFVEVRYDTQRVGIFNKEVIFMTNEALEEPLKIIVKGEVRESVPKK